MVPFFKDKDWCPKSGHQKADLEQVRWQVLAPVGFSKGKYALGFHKIRKKTEKEKWRNPFSSAVILEARCREIAEKIQNISEIGSHVNHKPVFMLSVEEFFSILFETAYLFLTFIHFIAFETLQKVMVWKMKKRNKANIFMQFFFLPLLNKRTKTILKRDDKSHTRRKKKQSTEVFVKRLLFKI